VRFGRSAGRDTRLAVCVPSTTVISASDEAKLRTEGVGLYRVEPGGVVEQLIPHDLALNVQLPAVGSLSRNVRVLLGSAYEHFRRANWREGFEDACQALEGEARRYLLRWIRTKRITVLKPDGTVQQLSEKRIKKMTMGQLADVYSRIQNKNRADSLIAKTLAKVNKDRIGVAHYKGTTQAEKRLRINVGQHMWSVIGALKELR
jgi:hypothetical protein